MSQVPFLFFPAALALAALWLPGAITRLLPARRPHAAARQPERPLSIGPCQDL
jgi:hypothetical protein